MMQLKGIAERLAVTEPRIDQGGVLWLRCDAARIREVAKAMNDCNARFVTMTAYELPRGEGFRLEYLWDCDGSLIGFPIHIGGNSIDSICDLCEAADWIEREIHDGFAIDFPGRVCEPLLLRPGDQPGVNLREVPQ